ncbi:GntR family transcriptional regulator [Lactobacillaceae bacterium Melli_B4]
MLDKANALPLYVQVKEQIINNINSDIYPPGFKIPNEQQLQADFDVSRITIRRAISELEDSGYLVKQQGKGTFVTHPHVERDLLSLNAYTDFKNNRDERPKRNIISLLEIVADVKASNNLELQDEERVTKLERVLEVSKDNYGFEINYYPTSLFPNLIEKIHNDSSLTKILNEDFHKFGKSSRKVLNVIKADQHLASLMNLSTGDNVYKVEKVTRDENNIPLYYSILYYDANKISFVINN